MADSTGGMVTSRVSSELLPPVAAASCPTAEPSRYDLDTLFIVQKGNLAVLHEAQALLADAIHAIALVQQAYLERQQRDFSPMAAVGQGLTMARDVVGLAVDTYARVGALLSRGLRLNFDR